MAFVTREVWAQILCLLLISYDIKQITWLLKSQFPHQYNICSKLCFPKMTTAISLALQFLLEHCYLPSRGKVYISCIWTWTYLLLARNQLNAEDMMMPDFRSHRSEKVMQLGDLRSHVCCLIIQNPSLYAEALMSSSEKLPWKVSKYSWSSLFADLVFANLSSH